MDPPDAGPRPRTASGAVLQDPDERRIQVSSWAVGLIFAGLTVVLVMLLAAMPSALGWVAAVLLAALGGAVLINLRAVVRAADRRRTREAGFTHILQGLSRSVSPESIVSAIVQELLTASGADHVVVVRRTGAAGRLEATLVSSSPGAPVSTTRLSGELMTGTTPQAAADAIARRVREAYGLKETTAAPLVAEGALMGALVLSQRRRDVWPAGTPALIAWAAGEVSAALHRAYAHEAAEIDARIDRLTGLPNRRYFDELAGMLTSGRRATDALGILMIDIDHFKDLNDRYGHATGDIVLRGVADVLVSSLRGEDTPARFGGEEFVVVLRRASLAQAVEVAERVRVGIGGSWTQDAGLADRVTVSVGVAVADAGALTGIGSLVARADAALYRAKREGRNRVKVG